MHRMFWPVAVGIVVIGATLGFVLAVPAVTVDPDHALYAATVESMRSGVGYHRAMDAGLRELYGGPVGSPLAFRQPTIFALWAMLPWSWPVFVGFVGVGTGLVVARLSRPWAGLLVVPWLLALGRPALVGGGHAQWMLVEFWAVPLALAAVWRQEAGDDLGAAAMATVAALFRELTAPLLLVGLVLAHRGGRPRWPWVLGVSLWVAAFVLHLRTAAGLTSPPGAEPPLLGTGGVDAVIGMASVGVPSALALVWAAAMVIVVVQRRWLLSCLVAIPVLGLLAERDYWGILALPAVLVAIFSVSVPDRPGEGPRARPVVRAPGT